MGKLSLPDIEERIKSPVLSDELREVKKHDQRACFHTEPTNQVRDIPYYDEFLQWVRNILDEKKHDVFKHLLTLPIETVDFTEGVLNELRKALYAQDKNINYTLTSKELIQDFQDYLENIGDAMFWDSEAFAAMKSNINAVMIVDLPKLPIIDGEIIQETKYATPYYYLLSPDRIVDAKVHQSGKIDWIIFKGKAENSYYAFDDQYFREFICKNNRIDQTTLIETPHELGYCPARMFWSTPFNSKSKMQRRAPISNSLAKLDDLLFWSTSVRHSMLASGFPIMMRYQSKCSYVDDDGTPCENGQIRGVVRIGNTDEMRPVAKQCPVCSKGTGLGAGSVVTAPVRRKENDPDLINGVQYVEVQVDAQKSLQEFLKQLAVNLQWNMIGVNREIGNDAAKNELQVSSGFESRLNVVSWVASNFAIAHKWTLETVGRLRYGKAFMSAEINYGTRFYLYEPDELIEAYDLSKKSGLPNFELSTQVDQILNTKYRTNPVMMQRVQILKELEPLPNYSLLELIDLPGKVNPDKLTLKKNFDDFISRFEREYTDVVSFMPFAEVETKIEFIQEVLQSYIDEVNAMEIEESDTETTATSTTLEENE